MRGTARLGFRVLVPALAVAGLTQMHDAQAQGDREENRCIAAISYHALDSAVVGRGTQGLPALGTYERISPDGRFVLRSYSGERVGTVSLMELPEAPGEPVRVYKTPFSNEAFPVQQTWRYLVDVSGEHYRFAEVLHDQNRARPVFRGGMTGFYAAASELLVANPSGTEASLGGQAVFIRSLSWPQNADSDSQGVGPLQLETIEVRDDGRTARVVRSSGPRFICGQRRGEDGGAFALPMISIDGMEFSAIPQSPLKGQPSMRVYGLATEPLAKEHPCDLRADLGSSPSKAVFGYPSKSASGPTWLTYSDLGSAYVFDRALKTAFRLDHARERTLVSAFPGLTRDGRVVYGATWRECTASGQCSGAAGYVVSDPYQSAAYRAHWQRRKEPAPKLCITEAEVHAERVRFAQTSGLSMSARARSAMPE